MKLSDFGIIRNQIKTKNPPENTEEDRIVH